MTFAEIVPGKSVLEPKFIIIVCLYTGEYEVDYNPQTDEQEIEMVYECFLEHLNKDLSLLRNRYLKMKGYGKKRIMRWRAKHDRAFIYGRKIGRNEPCPCGSGKKYKKCCGSNLE